MNIKCEQVYLKLIFNHHIFFFVAKITQLKATYDKAATGINIIVRLNSNK